MSIRRAIEVLVVLYGVTVGLAIWRVRDICLIQRDECDYRDLVATVLSSPLVAIACAVYLGMLIFITVHVFRRVRDKTERVERESSRRRINANGTLVATVVFVLYLGASLAALMGAATGLEPSNIDKVDWLFWIAVWAPWGTLIVYMVLWHLNEYFVKPAPGIMIFLFFCVTFGSDYWFVRSVFADL